MLALDADRWDTLSHAYGCATDIPDLLRELEAAPPCDDWQAEPYFTLWGSLYHQDNIYDASYAAVPHLLAQCKRDPSKAPWTIAQLATRIELARQRKWGPDMPDDLKTAYNEAKQQLPIVCVEMLIAQNEPHLMSIAATALALSKGEDVLAEVYSELEAKDAKACLEWLKPT